MKNLGKHWSKEHGLPFKVPEDLTQMNLLISNSSTPLTKPLPWPERSHIFTLYPSCFPNATVSTYVFSLCWESPFSLSLYLQAVIVSNVCL